MFQIRKAAITAAALGVCFVLGLPIAMAQSAATDSVASSPKQVEKAQRKAARKAARAKKNAELGTLEKNGYLPGSNDAHYPQDAQNAEGNRAPPKKEDLNK